MAKFNPNSLLLLAGGVALGWYLRGRQKAKPATEGYTPKVPPIPEPTPLDTAERNHNWAYGVSVGRQGYGAQQVSLPPTYTGRQQAETPGWWPTTLSLPQPCGDIVCPPGTQCVQQETSTACVYPDNTRPRFSR